MGEEESVEELLKRLQGALLKEIDLNELLARSRVAHKWKATFRSLLLREAVFWRTTDLLHQSHLLYKVGHLLGARILVRSALETVAVLSYLNQKTDDVISGKLDFHEFSLMTTRLLFGSKDKSTDYEAVNILSILDRCDRRYGTIKDYYAQLSESAHPNLDGLLMGYSRANPEDLKEQFSNHWAAMYSSSHEGAIRAVAMTFEFEYNNAWKDAFEALEKFLVDNDTQLEATRTEAS